MSQAHENGHKCRATKHPQYNHRKDAAELRDQLKELKGAHKHYDETDYNQEHFEALTRKLGERDIWIFGFGSLVHTPGFEYSDSVAGYIRGWRRVWWQGSTDHRGTVESPGRTVTLTQDDDAITYGVAYKLAGEHDQQRETLRYLEWREKQYDHREYVDVFAQPEDETPVLEDALCYIATSNAEANPNYLGPAELDDIARQVAFAVGPSGPNVEYLYKLAHALDKEHVRDSDKELFELVEKVRAIQAEENKH